MWNAAERTARAAGGGSSLAGIIAKTILEWLSYSPEASVISKRRRQFYVFKNCNKGGTAFKVLERPLQ